MIKKRETCIVAKGKRRKLKEKQKNWGHFEFYNKRETDREKNSKCTTFMLSTLL